jgi:hypothetical protein
VGKSALGLLILAAALGGRAVAQKPVIRVGVEAVVVDVSVFDAKGRPCSLCPVGFRARTIF